MAITSVLSVDASGNKTKVKLQYFALDNSGELQGGSILVRYISSVDDSDLPDTGTVQEKRIKQETEIQLINTFNKYVNPPSLVYVAADTVGAKTVAKWLSERNQAQLTGVPSPPDTKQMVEGVFLKLIEILQSNGELPV
jgi:hypothetical protein